MRQWTQRLREHGIKLSGDGIRERLTNVRFADDLIIFAFSADELVEMLNILIIELSVVGLELNSAKSKISTLDRAVYECVEPVFLEVAGGLIELAREGDSHKYLGVMLLGRLRDRGRTMLAHRLKCAWSKYHAFRHSLTNKHVDIKLRLRLLDAVVTPCALYCLSIAHLTKTDVGRLGIGLRKMLRLMVGYVKHQSDSWSDMHRRLN